MKPLNMKDTLSTELSNMGVTGSHKSDITRKFQNESEESEKRERPTDFLKKGITIKDIHNLVKNKKLSNNKIKQEIRKLLKNEEELTDFLKSFIPKKEENKEDTESTFGDYTGPVGGVIGSRNESKTETKEASASGGGVGAYDSLFGGDMSEDDIKKVETKEATTSASSGQYSTPKMWAKSTSKKDWRGRSKTQIPGGKFVQVKKKCKRFPYCNQGDIKALNIFENETLKRTIGKLSREFEVHEDFIKDIISYEFQKYKK